MCTLHSCSVQYSVQYSSVLLARAQYNGVHSQWDKVHSVHCCVYKLCVLARPLWYKVHSVHSVCVDCGTLTCTVYMLQLYEVHSVTLCTVMKGVHMYTHEHSW